MTFDRSKMPEGGWTPENTKQYKDYDLAQYRLKAESENLEDPEGRLKKGQRIRWAHDQRGDGIGDMEIIYLCCPTGLYRRPIRDGDEDWRIEHATMMGKGTPCDKDEEGAVYQPDNLMVFFRYLYSDSCTTGHAKDMIVVAESVSDEDANTCRVGIHP